MKREARIPGLRRALHLGDDGAVDREIDEELQFHLDARRDELVARGIAPAEASRIVREEFGNVREARQELARVDKRRRAHARRADWSEALVQDAKLALRRMRATPGFTLAIVVSIAIGIGTNAAMFRIADRLLFEPPSGVVRPDRLATVVLSLFSPFDHAMHASTVSSYPSFSALEAAPAIGGMALRGHTRLGVALGGDAWTGDVEAVSANYFSLLGARAERGRVFSTAADSSSASPGAVISDELWRARMGQDPSVLGRVIRVGRGSYPIIGVAAPGFSGVGLERVDVWLPVTEAATLGVAPRDWKASGSYYLDAVVRLRDGVSAKTAESQLTTSLRRFQATNPANPFAGKPDTLSTVGLLPLTGLRKSDASLSPAASVARWLAILSALVLLISCANVAGLLLVRSMRRAREFALRQALGMSRSRLTTQLFVEAALLAVIGALAAMAALRITAPLLRDLVAPQVLWAGASTRSDLLLVGITLAGVLIVALASSLIPARVLGRGDASAELKPMGHTARAGRSRAHMILVGAQMAICTVLLAIAGVFVQSLHRVRTLDYGLNLDVIAAELELSQQYGGWVDQDARLDANARVARAVATVQRIPGVIAVAVTDASPFRSMYGGGIALPGRPQESLPQSKTGSYEAQVSPNYFAATGTPIVRGRAFAARDTVPGAAPVVIINQSMARLYWPGGNPLGQCAYVNSAPTCSTIVGIARDQLRMFVTEDPRLEVFVPLAVGVGNSSRATLLIHAANPTAAMPMIQRALQQLDPSAPYADIKTLRSRLSPQTQSWLLGATMMSGFGLLALLLAAVGLYGVMAYTIASRTHEIGVRIAVGASRANVLRLFVGQGLRIVIAGMLIGGVLSFVVLRRLSELLFHTAPTDPASLLAAVVVLLAAAFVASLIPARRAASIDPLEALRQE